MDWRSNQAAIAEHARQSAYLDDFNARDYHHNAQKVINDIVNGRWIPPPVEYTLEKAKKSIELGFKIIAGNKNYHEESQQKLLLQKTALVERANTPKNRADVLLLNLRIQYENNVHEIEFRRDMQKELDKAINPELLEYFMSLCKQNWVSFQEEYI